MKVSEDKNKIKKDFIRKELKYINEKIKSTHLNWSSVFQFIPIFIHLINFIYIMMHTRRILFSTWHPRSYESFRSYIDYFPPDNSVFQYLKNLPPIVSSAQIRKLRQ